MSQDNRRKWCVMLAKLVRPMDPEAAASALIDMLPLLESVPDECFCRRSLQHVASVCRRMPTFGELQDALADWWRDNRHEFAPKALPAPAPTGGMDAIDHLWVAYYRKREAEAFANVAPHANDPRAHVLSLILANSPRAWSVITGLAVHRPVAPSDEDKRRVSQTLRPLSGVVHTEWVDA